MLEVIRISIRSVSGYGLWVESYKDVLTITKDHIQYTYTPAVETPSNATLKWRYGTNNYRFYQQFHTISEMLVDLLNSVEDLDSQFPSCQSPDLLL